MQTRRPVRMFACALAVLASACSQSGSNGRRDGGAVPVDAAAPGLDAIPPGDDAAVEPDAEGPPDAGMQSCGDTWLGEYVAVEGCACLPGTTGACFAVAGAQRGVGVCGAGRASCVGSGELGTWGPCEGAGAPGEEVCNGLDDDCDGSVDPRCGCTIGEQRPCYPGPPASQNVGWCHVGHETCIADPDGAAVWGPCEGAILPGIELCDHRDRDCDGMVDDGCTCPPNTTESCYAGPAGTAGVGACRAGTRRCVVIGRGGSLWLPCQGEVLPRSEDCESGMDLNCNGLTGCNDPACATSTVCMPPCMPGVNHYTLRPSADVLFLADRSGSMTSSIPGGRSRWQALRDAMHAVLPPLDATLDMGLVIFPDPDQCSVPSAPVVPVSTPSASAILARLDAADPPFFASTPTLEALQAAERYFMGAPSARARFLVLATDGEPNCSGDLASVVDKLRSLRSRFGVDTFVLGIPGTDSSLADALDQMAVAGGRPRAGTHRFYDASTASLLESSLRSIVSTTGCVFGLGRTVVDPSRLQIFVDGVLVPQSGTEGWDFTDPGHRQIRLYGSQCTRVNDGRPHTVRADLTC